MCLQFCLDEVTRNSEGQRAQAAAGGADGRRHEAKNGLHRLLPLLPPAQGPGSTCLDPLHTAWLPVLRDGGWGGFIVPITLEFSLVSWH